MKVVVYGKNRGNENKGKQIKNKFNVRFDVAYFFTKKRLLAISVLKFSEFNHTFVYMSFQVIA